MARLEPAHLGSIDVPMDLKGAVAIPEPSSDAQPLSPTDSVDSAIGNSPRLVGHSGKYLSYGGPGFSVASFDAVTGAVDRIPVPLPLSCAEMAEFVAFPQSPVLCMSVVGETQVWAGTRTGSLHVFELEPNLRFSSHAITLLDSPVLCIASRDSSTAGACSPGDSGPDLHSALRSLHIDVLLGSSNGAVTVISGQATPNGGLKDPSNSLRKPRKVLSIGSIEVREEEEEEGEEAERNVNCIVAVHMTDGQEVFWCSYGRMVVIFSKDRWEEIGRLDGSLGHPKAQHAALKDSEIVQLVPSEHGVWSALSNSPTISLWDTVTLAPKLTIACCTLSDCEPLATDMLQITALHFSCPNLLVGTSQGDLLVFHIQNKQTTRLSRAGPVTGGGDDLEYKVLTAEHCGPIPILDIFATPLRTEHKECRSPSRSTTATPTSLQLLVVCGQNSSSSLSDVSSSSALFYELLTSPSPSPLASPLRLPSLTPSRPPSTSHRHCSSVASAVSSTSSVSTFRRPSLGRCAGSLPKLSLHSVSPTAPSLLPLRSS